MDEFDVFVFLKPRTGHTRVYVSLTSVYSVLNLSTFSNQPSNWVYRCEPRWRKALDPLFCANQFVHSTFIRTSSKNKNKMSFHERCLPASSVSIPGLIALLYRFSYNPGQGGGLGVDDAVSAATSLFNRLLGLCHELSWDMSLELCSTWENRWPRPATHERIVLKVIRGRIDAHAFLLNLRGVAQDLVAAGWLKKLEAPLSRLREPVSVCEFVKVLMKLKKQNVLVGQVLHETGTRIELELAALAKGVKTSDYVAFDWVEWRESVLQPTHMDRLLAEYHANGVSTLRTSRIFGMPNDGGHVNALPVHVGFIITPKNLAVLCPPLVGQAPQTKP